MQVTSTVGYTAAVAGFCLLNGTHVGTHGEPWVILVGWYEGFAAVAVHASFLVESEGLQNRKV